MGFLDILKKKKKTETSNIENNTLLNDIPLPPPGSEPTNKTESISTLPEENKLNSTVESNSFDNLSQDPIEAEEPLPMTAQNEPEFKLDTNAGTEPIISEEKVPLKKDEKTEDDFDFALPDFSDEDLKIGELGEEIPTLEEHKEIETPITEEILSIPKDNSEIKSKGPKYLEMNNCIKIFENIFNSQETITKTKEQFSDSDLLSKSLTQQYKNSYDDLDSIQEKLMEIDKTLFER